MNELTVLIGGLILFIMATIGIAIWSESYTCHAKYADYKPVWGIMSGCQAEWNGKMTPVENIRLI